MGLLDNKRALVVGVASNRSIAWGIAQAMHREGAQIALTYQNEKLQKRVEKFASELDSKITLPCDVSSDTQIQTVFGDLSKYWDSFDILVHSIAFAPRELLDGDQQHHCPLGQEGREEERGERGGQLDGGCEQEN